MPRPCKRRHICAIPACMHFAPQSDGTLCRQKVTMSLDEFECIRLMELEHLTQEQCAVQMQVARTTIQAIYSSAREKLADCLVHAKELRIEGGHYTLCKEGGRCCRKHCMEAAGNQEKKGDFKTMKIGVTYENGQIFQHFGHTEQFKVYDVQDNKVVSSEVVDTNGSGHGALAGFLQEHQIEVLICGGIGGGARNALADAGIKLYGGVSGSADEAVEALLKNELVYNPDVMCNHHDEHHGDCGSHGCGGHNHTCGS